MDTNGTMPDERETRRERRAALLVATVSSFTTPFMGAAVNVALPGIAAELRLDAAAMGWIASSYLLAAAVALIPIGRLADGLGRRRIFAWGALVFTVSSLFLGLVGSFPAMVALRVVQGVGSAAIFATSTAILISVYPAKERGRVLGINVASVYVGLSAGPALGGLLTESLGWRSVFLVNVPLGLLVLAVLLSQIKREWTDGAWGGFDVPGTASLGLSLTSLLVGFDTLPAPLGAALALAGLAGLVLFGLWEKRAPSPLVDMALITGNTAFLFSNVAALIHYAATFAVGFLLSLYLQYLKGLSPREAGLLLAAQPAVMALVSPLAGRLSDRVEPRIVASIGMGLTAAGLALFFLLERDTSLAAIGAVLGLLGLGFGLFSSPNTNAVMSSVARSQLGVASATVATMRLVGQMMSMGVALLIIALHVGDARITPDRHAAFLAGVKLAFAVFAILSLAGIFASLARGRVRDQR